MTGHKGLTVMTRAPIRLIALLASGAISWTALSAHAETCQDRVNSSGAYVFSHSVPIGNGMVECYVRARDGSGQPIKDSIAFIDEPAVGEGAQNSEADKQKDPVDCEMKKRSAPAGGAQLANEFCAWVSEGSPSYDISFKGKKTEIDALRGKTWMECKCGYLSTVLAAESGVAWGLSNFSGAGQQKGKDAHDPGMDSEILRQKEIAQVCGLDYGIWVSHEKVGEYFRQRYPGVKVYVDSTWPLGGQCN